MKAIGYTEYLPLDEDGALIAFYTQTPETKGHDLLVEVKAVSVNPVDTKIRKNRPASKDAPVILGWDAAGIVSAVGEGVTAYKPGDEVWYAGAIGRPGTNAEYHLVDERIVGHKPKTLSMEQAAAMPLTILTGYETLFDRLDVNRPVPGADRAILIIGGAGGVGSITIQLVRALTDLTVIATASRPETIDWVKQQGAHHVINHHENLSQQLEALGLSSPGFVFSTTHSDSYITQVADLIAPQGRFALIDDPSALDIRPLKQKSVSVHWEFMYTRSAFETADMQRQRDILNELASLVDAGKIQSTLSNHLGAMTPENLRKAHQVLENGAAIGKMVLTV